MSSIRSRSGRSDRDRGGWYKDSLDMINQASHFIKVKYGDNKEAIFNAWCTGHSLVYHIHKTCSCGKDVIVDLCDLEGNIQHLPSRLGDYANSYMDGRRTYILLQVDKQGDSEQERYSFLLNDVDTLHPVVSEKFKRLQESATHDRRRDKSTGKMTWGTMRAMTRVTAKVVKSRDGPRRSSRDVTKS